MSVRRSLNGRQHAIPAEVTWIEFPRTDGDPKQWPKNTNEVIGKDGHVNFMRPMGIDESTGVLWRKVVGKYVAQKLGEPVGKEYVLRAWPAGYQLFDHNKGAAKAPRHDPYLFGSVHVLRFRSANEFAPHAAWLVTDPTLNRANCECKYCAKKPQREITQQLGLPSKRASDSPVPLTGRREKRPRESRKVPHAALRRAPKPQKPRLTGPQQWMVPEKTTDVRDALGRHDGKAIRYFRKGELVWCSITPAILVPGNDDGITFWPGLVDVCTTVPEVISRIGPGADKNGDAPASRSTSPTSPTSPAHPPEITWSVQQHVSYKIKLLATSSSILLSEDEVLPYLAYAPTDPILNVLRAELPHSLNTPAVAELDEQEQRMFAFDPCAPEDEVVRFKQAIAPYTLAIQIASKMATYWTPTDEWECKFTIPSSPPRLPPTSSQSTDPQPSLHNIINSVMTQNSQILGSASASQAAPGVDSRILGEMHRSNSNVPQVVTQMRYQGLWWGGERIWTDELVRLKLARCQFVPQGNEVVQTPAGSGESTKAWKEEHGDDMDSKMSGAGEKGLFMLLEGLFVVEVPHPENGALIKECRASGMLYELVDEDWQPPPAGPEDHDETNHANTTAAPAAPPSDVPVDSPMSASMSGPFTTQPPAVLPTGGSISAPPAAPPPISPQDESLNAQLSHPVSGSTYPLPHAPKGFKFRPILAKGHEVVLSLSLISGRYYPRLTEHPLLRPAVEHAFAAAAENEDALYMLRHLIALEGLLAGVHQSMEPKIWRNGRHIMFKEATSQAKSEFKVRQEELKNVAEGNVDVPLEDVTMGEASMIDDNSMIDPALLNAPAVVPVA